MTHDELVDIAIAKDLNNLIRKQMKAIDAVFELHKPMLWKNLGNDTDGYKCEVCEGNSYPCPTIQAIEKDLV